MALYAIVGLNFRIDAEANRRVTDGPQDCHSVKYNAMSFSPVAGTTVSKTLSQRLVILPLRRDPDSHRQGVCVRRTARDQRA